MRLSLSSIAGSIGILLVAIVLSVSCRPDVEPVIPEGAVDMGIVMTREDGSTYKLTRYCPMEKTGDWDGSGKPDNKTELRDYDYADDAARAVLKGRWRLPTRAEWATLRKQCTWNWINVNDVLGYQVIAENENSIFIPVAGFRQDDVLREIGDSSNYWSSSSDTEYPTYAWYLFTKKGRYVGEYCSSRYYGHSVRPVTEE